MGNLYSQGIWHHLKALVEVHLNILSTPAVGLLKLAGDAVISPPTASLLNLKHL